LKATALGSETFGTAFTAARLVKALRGKAGRE
jgi:hypothetical protein